MPKNGHYDRRLMGSVERAVDALCIEDKCLIHEACWNLSRNQAAVTSVRTTH